VLLEKKIVAITGTGSGVGRASALLFARHGASIVGGDVREDWNDVTRSLVEAEGGRFLAARCDVSVEEDVAALVTAARSTFGRLDVIVNNTGVASSRPDLTIEATDEQEYDRLMDVNAKGVFFGCKHATAAFKAQADGGVIVNTGSAAGLVGWGRVAYGMGKAAVIGLTRTLAIELAPFGIRVNCTCPGAINTNYGRPEDAAFQPRSPAELERISRPHPLGRPIEPEDVAAAGLYLASDLSANVTGVALPVDGGYTAA
jgi:NAD(P)-dependent dehydrogenase (short-subunit alcohol dehydrogenase family)